MMRLSLLIVRLLFQSCQTFGQNEAFSPPTPSPVNWSLLHLNKLGIMKRCFHSVIIINHDSGLPCILGLATQMFSKNTNDEEPGTNSSMQCLPSHNLIFLIDRKIQTSSLSVIVLTYLPQFQEQGPSHPEGWCYKEEHFCCISPKVSSLSWVFGPPGLWLFGDWKI